MWMLQALLDAGVLAPEALSNCAGSEQVEAGHLRRHAVQQQISKLTEDIPTSLGATPAVCQTLCELASCCVNSRTLQLLPRSPLTTPHLSREGSKVWLCCRGGEGPEAV